MKAFHEVRNYNSDLMVWYSSYENISFVAHWQKEIEFVYVNDYMDIYNDLFKENVIEFSKGIEFIKLEL